MWEKGKASRTHTPPLDITCTSVSEEQVKLLELQRVCLQLSFRDSGSTYDLTVQASQVSLSGLSS